MSNARCRVLSYDYHVVDLLEASTHLRHGIPVNSHQLFFFFPCNYLLAFLSVIYLSDFFFPAHPLLFMMNNVLPVMCELL